MRMGFSQMLKTQIATATQADGKSLLENEQMNTSVEFADEFGLTEHERKQAKKRLSRCLHR